MEVIFLETLSTGIRMWNYKANLPLELLIKDRDGCNFIASNALEMEVMLSDDSLAYISQNRVDRDMPRQLSIKDIHRNLYKLIERNKKQGLLNISVRIVG